MIAHLKRLVTQVKFTDKLEATIEGLPDIVYAAQSEFPNKKELARNQVSLFEGGFHRMSPCEFGRFHSNITSFCGELRHCLQIGGEPLHEIDVACSQPLFLACLACEKYLQERDKRETDNQTQEIDPYDLRSVPTDLSLLLDRVSAGQFYDDFMQDDDWSRPEVKELIIRVIFGNIYQMRTELGGEWLKQTYPTAFGVIEGLKRTHGYEYVGRHLQRLESGIVIDTVCERLRRDYSHIPIITCHDSIATTERHLETVQKVFKEGFASFSVQPSFKIKEPN